MVGKRLTCSRISKYAVALLMFAVVVVVVRSMSTSLPIRMESQCTSAVSDNCISSCRPCEAQESRCDYGVTTVSCSKWCVCAYSFIYFIYLFQVCSLVCAFVCCFLFVYCSINVSQSTIYPRGQFPIPPQPSSPAVQWSVRVKDSFPLTFHFTL